MPEQNIIESYHQIPADRPIDQLLPPPAVADVRVRVHLEKSVENAAVADNVMLDLSKFSKDTEFNLRKFGEKGIAVSPRNPKTNAVFEFVYDDASGVKQINLLQNDKRTQIFLNEAKPVIGPNGAGTLIRPNKLQLDEVQKTFQKALEENGFKYYQENPEIDKKKGMQVPNSADSVYSSPVPNNGEKKQISLV